jgi:hypothetical protein
VTPFPCRPVRPAPPPRASFEPVADVVAEDVVAEEVVAEDVVVDAVPVDLLAATPEVEAQMSVEEEIERRTAQEHNDTPHFRKDAE